ncbi:MAG: porin family protein [Muribaculaceae bacterium]|nr:porin family protein [Muribaculaceae bacterium]
MFRHISMIIFVFSTVLNASAQDNDKILNRQFADMKLLHLGFSVGTHTQDLQFTHNGYTTDNGETWHMEIPDFSPGFNVTVLADLRLGKHFNLRFSPGMYFGNKVVKMHDTTNNESTSQNVKTNYVVLPIELKISAERHRNMRPYLVGGVMASFDVSKKRTEMLRFNTTDFLLTVGLGCDIYLPFFKLCPELKFCFGLTDVLQHNRPDLSDDPTTMKYTNSIKKITQQMVVLSFYFE